MSKLAVIAVLGIAIFPTAVTPSQQAPAHQVKSVVLCDDSAIGHPDLVKKIVGAKLTLSIYAAQCFRA